MRSIESPKPLTVALVGATGYAAMYVDRLLAYHRTGRIRLKAATIVNPNEASEVCNIFKSIGCRVYQDFETMIAHESGKVDLCAIPTGIHLHCSMTMAALNAGMNVLVEKPLTAREDEARQMAQARARSGLEVFVGFQTMYMDSLWKTKKQLVQQKFGKVKSIKSIALWPRPTSYYTRNNWAGKLSVGDYTILDSPVNNAMAHFVMMPLFLSGKEVETAASIVKIKSDAFRAQSIQSFDTFSARATTDTEIDLLFNFSHSTQELYRPTIEVVCENGTLQWFENQSYRYVGLDQSSPIPTGFNEVDARTEMFEKVFSRLQTGTGNCCTLKHASSHTSFVNQVHRALSIIDFPDSSISTEIRDERPYLFVPGLGERMIHSHQSGHILSETDSSWLPSLSTSSVDS
ncbi:MAG: Gfo/Idh/MocA family protein [Puniceicoccales bacterium]